MPERDCTGCGERRRISAKGLCRSCYQRDRSRPVAYAARLGDQGACLTEWFEPFAAWVSERLSPARAIEVLKATSTHLAAGPVTPEELLAAVRPSEPSRSVGTLARSLEAFFASAGLSCRSDDEAGRLQARRLRIVSTTPEPFGAGVSGYLAAQVEARRRARRTGTKPLADSTLELRIGVLRDLACFLLASRPAVAGWELVSTADLEAFLSTNPTLRALRVGALRSFFAWARTKRLVLVNPTTGLRPGGRQVFVGAVVTAQRQQELYQRWTGDAAHPHEAFVGLMALIHAASRAELRALRVDDVDHGAHRVKLRARPHPVPLDPATWAALQRCLALRESRGRLNPHVLVTRVTAGRDCPVSAAYLTHILDPAETSLRSLRSTRLVATVSEMDPKFVSAAFGLNLAAPLYYLGDSVDDSRLSNL